MASLTSRTERRRQIRRKKAGRQNARKRNRVCSPPFPVHPEGYDPNAPDAKKQVDSEQ